MGTITDVLKQNPSKRGLAILVSNDYSEVKELGTLVGSVKDGNKMKSVFERLEIATLWKQNITLPQLRELLREVYTLRVSKSYKSISFVFSGHGQEKDLLFMNDGKTVHLQEIVNAFAPDQARNIGNVPKLFFIDACRGKESFQAVTVPRCGDGVQVVNNHKSSPLYRGGTEAKTVFVPPKGNMLIAFSNIANNRALEGKDGGIWTKALAKRLVESKEHIETVLTYVRQDLQHMYQDPLWRDNMQLAETISRLLQPVYLHPDSLQCHDLPTPPQPAANSSPPGPLSQRDRGHCGHFRGKLLNFEQTKKIKILSEEYSGGSPFVCTLEVVNCSNGRPLKFRSDECGSKGDAKESASQKAILSLEMQARGATGYTTQPVQTGQGKAANASPPLSSQPKKTTTVSPGNKDPISKLKEHCEKNKLPQPEYKEVESENANFVISVKVAGLSMIGDRKTTKKDARASAAQKAIDKLGI